jgi:AMP deaminase
LIRISVAIIIILVFFLSGADVDVESAITDDMIQIYRGVQHCLELRNKYIRISLQRSHDNPKNNVDHWKIYPEPPRPRWTYNADDNTWQDHKHDLAKVGVGQDFDMKECEIPGEDGRTFNADAGVYQVFDEHGRSA